MIVTLGVVKSRRPVGAAVAGSEMTEITRSERLARRTVLNAVPHDIVDAVATG